VNAKPELRQQALALMREHPHLSDREIARRISVGNKTVSRWRSMISGEQEPYDVLASRDLCALLSEQGIRMTERRLRSWRQAGYLTPLHRRWAGRDSTYVWAREALEQGLEVDRLLRRYGSGDRALVGLFSRGYVVDGDKVKAAYGRLLAYKADDLDGVLRSFQGIVDHPDDASWDRFAEHILHSFAHSRRYRSIRRMRRAEEGKLPSGEQSSPAQYVEASVRRAARVFLRGRMESDAEIRAMLERSPFGSSKSEMSINQQVALSKKLQARMSLGALARIIDTVSIEELARTRDDVLAVLRVFEGIFFKPMVHRTSLAETYPDGLIAHWLRSDPFMFGFLLLYFQSIRLDPTFRDGIDGFVETTKELLPELDEIVEKLMTDLDRAVWPSPCLERRL
jgi:hypothetical protein